MKQIVIVIFFNTVPLRMWFEQVLLSCHLHNTHRSLFTKLIIFDWFEFQLHESELQVLLRKPNREKSKNNVPIKILRIGFEFFLFC